MNIQINSLHFFKKLLLSNTKFTILFHETDDKRVLNELLKED